MAKKQARQVTLVCVTGVNIVKALYGLMVSASRIKFDFIVLVTPKLPRARFRHFSIEKPIGSDLDSLDEYSKYILYNLYHHINTEFCLVVQADGYVLNGELWREEFREFDYIGAPWPIAADKYIDPFGQHQRVGNGGFSLRSKKLLLVPQRIRVPWEVNEGSFYRHFNQNSYSEDGNICVHNRHLFEKAGCKFAPLNIAMVFSRELDLQDFKFGPTFGFHKYRPDTTFVRRTIKQIKHFYKQLRK